MENEYYEHYEPIGADMAVGTLVMMLLMAYMLVGVALYVVSALFTTRLLKNAGHRTPMAGWVPIWNGVALYEVAGIRMPWAWMGVLLGASFIGGLVPYLGFLVTAAAMAAAVLLTVWCARGVQKALGLDSTGGIVLAVLVPLAWLIWMAVRSGRVAYRPMVAVEEGSTFPMNWFGEGDPWKPFAPAQAQ